MEFWIARNENGTLEIFKEKPYITIECEWFAEGEEYLNIYDEDSFPEVTFENSPKKVEIKLIEE